MYDRHSSSVWHRRWDELLDRFFQPLCLGCRGVAAGGFRNLSLCSTCRARLVLLQPPRCRLCARRIGRASRPAASLCLPCRRHPPPYERLTAIWSYEPPLDSCIHALKFSRMSRLAAPLAAPLASRLAADSGAVDLIVPVPLHWRRALARGFDQAELLARSVAQQLGLPLALVLRRRSTRAQSRLPLADRRANVRGAFSVPGRRPISGHRVLLVDDVVTSGATLREAARSLRRAGAAAVEAAVVARTPACGGARQAR